MEKLKSIKEEDPPEVKAAKEAANKEIEERNNRKQMSRDALSATFFANEVPVPTPKSAEGYKLEICSSVLGLITLGFGGLGEAFHFGAIADCQGAAPAMFVLFFIFLSLCSAGWIWKFQQGCSGYTMIGLTLITGSAFAAQAGIFGTGMGITHAVRVSSQEAFIVASFAGIALASFIIVVLLAKGSCCYNGKTNHSLMYWGVGTGFSISTTCIGGGIVWWHTIGTAAKAAIVNPAAYPLCIGIALLFGVLVFLCIGSRSADKYGPNDDFVEGFFKDNTARVAVSLFWSVSTTGLVGSFTCSALSHGYNSVLMVSGIIIWLFPILYYFFFKNDKELDKVGKFWKGTTILLTSVSLGAIAFGTVLQAPWIWQVGVGVFSVCTVGITIQFLIQTTACCGPQNGFWSSLWCARKMPAPGIEML